MFTTEACRYSMLVEIPCLGIESTLQAWRTAQLNKLVPIYMYGLDEGIVALIFCFRKSDKIRKAWGTIHRDFRTWLVNRVVGMLDRDHSRFILLALFSIARSIYHLLTSNRSPSISLTAIGGIRARELEEHEMPDSQPLKSLLL